MITDLITVLLSMGTVFLILGPVSLLKKRGVNSEICRKLVHILLSNWVLLAMVLFDSPWTACAAPALFVLLNYLSWRKGLFSSIERETDNTPGTVWYAVSLFLLCLAGFSLKMPWVAACGMLAMGYGDGLAALVGIRWGRHSFPGRLSSKSLEGTLTVVAFSALAVGIVCLIFAREIAFPAAFVCGILAGAIELYSPRGIDNLTLPLGVSGAVLLMALVPASVPALVCLAVTLIILLAAYYLNALTLPGVQAATLLGVLLYVFGGWLSYGALVLFFVAGSVVSKIGKAKKADASALHKRKGARTVAQVAANGAPALVFAALYFVTGRPAWLLAVLVSFGAATADTFSSEIGMLSQKQPVSILTLRPIQKGISGGVSLLGFASAAAGAFLVSLLALPTFGLAGVGKVLLFGFLGSVIDSLMGAALQVKYHLPEGGLTEAPTALGKAAGIAWVNNDVVNFASVLAAGSLLGLFMLLRP